LFFFRRNYIYSKSSNTWVHANVVKKYSSTFIIRYKYIICLGLKKILCFGQPYRNQPTLDFFFIGVFIIEVSILKKKIKTEPTLPKVFKTVALNTRLFFLALFQVTQPYLGNYSDFQILFIWMSLRKDLCYRIKKNKKKSWPCLSILFNWLSETNKILIWGLTAWAQGEILICVHTSRVIRWLSDQLIDLVP